MNWEALARELAVLIRELLKEMGRHGHLYHEFAGCPRSNFETSNYGLRRGCLLCRLNRLLLKVEESIGGG